MRKFFVILGILGALLLCRVALAADFFFSPNSGEVVVGQQFDVLVKIGTGASETINAAQTKINFDKDLLGVVSINREDSVFNSWLQLPTYANEDGTIEFAGGVIKSGVAGGVSGSSLQILKIVLKAKAEGSAKINFVKDDTEITANDGLGTMLLSGVSSATFTISPAPPPEVKPIPLPPPTPEIPKPLQITRPIISAVKLPEIPNLDVPLYPSQEQWYNNTSPFLVKWDLPKDAIAIASAVNGISIDAIKSPKSEGLFENKIFTPLKDGINYLHVQFKNTKGWGGVTNYKISVDTIPPFVFEATIKEGNPTDNPQPTLMFSSGDSTSGIDYYQIKIPGFEPVNVSESSYKIPLLKPGDYRISVRAFDKASNSSESIVQLKITPIAVPEITYYNKDVFIGMENLSIKGKSLPDGKILIFIKKITGETVYNDSVLVDGQGKWEAALTPSLKKGSYFAEVIAQDKRGAYSLSVKTGFINVRQKPFLSLGTFELTIEIFLAGVIALLLLGFLLGYSIIKGRTKEKQSRIYRNIIVAERDVTGALETIDEDIEKSLDVFEDHKISKQETAELEIHLKRIKGYISKVKGYIQEGIEKINK